MTHATKGGETGMNGETYKGGQFLPNTTLPKQDPKARRAATRKQEVAPYTWEVAPSADHKSLWRYLSGTYTNYSHTTKQLSPFYPFIESQERNCPHFNRNDILELIARWNAGERWF